MSQFVFINHLVIALRFGPQKTQVKLFDSNHVNLSLYFAVKGLNYYQYDNTFPFPSPRKQKTKKIDNQKGHKNLPKREEFHLTIFFLMSRNTNIRNLLFEKAFYSKNYVRTRIRSRRSKGDLALPSLP